MENIQLGPDKWFGVTHINSQSSSVTGRYMVIKLRIGENGLGQSQLKLYISTVFNGLSEGAGVSIKVSEDGQWHTIVVDLATRVKNPDGYFAAEDGVYHVRYFQMRPFSNNQGGAQADDYMDISYIAFCDSLDDIKDVAGESYEWSESATSNVIKSAATGE